MSLIACNQTKGSSKVIEKQEGAKKYSDPKDVFTQFYTLEDEVFLHKDSIVLWEGYQRVKESLENLKNNTPNEVLNSSENLVQNASWMRDTITVKVLNNKGMRARMNTFYNQSLRLQDMKNIPSITIPEIKKQTEGLFIIFRMINRKIDAIYKQEDFENDLLEDDFIFSKLDSIK